MRKKLDLPSNMISLKEASVVSGYHPDYLSSMIRDGKIPGKKIGKAWFVVEEDLKRYVSKNQFTPISSKDLGRKTRNILIVIIILLLSVIIFQYFNTNSEKEELIGDRDERLQSAKIGELEITTYAIDGEGGVEVSIDDKKELNREELYKYIELK